MSINPLMTQQADLALSHNVRKPHFGHLTPAQAQKAGEKFAGMFIGEMLKPMFSGINTNGPFGGGEGEAMFRSLLIGAYGKLMADHGNGLGIGPMVAHALLQAQEEHQ